MGRVRTKTVKKASRQIIEKYYMRLTTDFSINKKVCEEIATIPTKRLRNKIAGFVTHMMRRIQRGPVRGISLKLQEDERERRDNYVPDISAVQTDNIEVDPDTRNMLRAIDFGNLPGVTTSNPPPTTGTTTGGTTVVKLTSINGEDGYVSRIITDGFSTTVCKVGDKGMFNIDSFRSIILFDTSTLPRLPIEKIELSLTVLSVTGAISQITEKMNNGPIGGSVDLKNSDYGATASLPAAALFNPQQSSSVVLPSTAFGAINFNGRTAFRLSGLATASFAPNTIFLGCGETLLTVTFRSSF